MSDSRDPLSQLSFEGLREVGERVGQEQVHEGERQIGFKSLVSSCVYDFGCFGQLPDRDYRKKG